MLLALERQDFVQIFIFVKNIVWICAKHCLDPEPKPESEPEPEPKLFHSRNRNRTKSLRFQNTACCRLLPALKTKLLLHSTKDICCISFEAYRYSVPLPISLTNLYYTVPIFVFFRYPVLEKMISLMDKIELLERAKEHFENNLYQCANLKKPLKDE